MNAIFTLIIGISSLILAVGSPSELIPAYLAGAENAIKFSLILFGSYSLWLSIMKIIEDSGIVKMLGKLLRPITKRLFPDESELTRDALNLNISANLLGTGGAATPAGLKAVSGMRHRKNATMLVVLNSTSLQLIPTTVIAMRAERGALGDILLPSLIATAFTTLLAIVAVKVLEK